MSTTTCCPLCGGIVAKYSVSFHTDFVMCSNEDCVYPFQDEVVFKDSVIDKRPPGTHNAVRKRKLVPAGDRSVIPSDTKVKKPKLAESKQKQSPLPALPKISAAPSTAVQSNPTIPSTARSVATTASATATSTHASAIPFAMPVSAIPSTAPASLQAQSTMMSLEYSASLFTPSSSVATATSSKASLPTSPIEGVPDLTFDFLPNDSWITPVTPPDKLATVHHTSKDRRLATSTPQAVPTNTASTLEALLFDEEFDIDFSNMESATTGALEYDAEFEAMFQQSL